MPEIDLVLQYLQTVSIFSITSRRPQIHLLNLANKKQSVVRCGRSVLGLQMGKFWQISTELPPLIDFRNWFSLSIFGIPLPIFFKLGMRGDIVKECSGIADG